MGKQWQTQCPRCQGYNTHTFTHMIDSATGKEIGRQPTAAILLGGGVALVLYLFTASPLVTSFHEIDSTIRTTLVIALLVLGVLIVGVGYVQHKGKLERAARRDVMRCYTCGNQWNAEYGPMDQGN